MRSNPDHWKTTGVLILGLVACVGLSALCCAGMAVMGWVAS